MHALPLPSRSSPPPGSHSRPEPFHFTPVPSSGVLGLTSKSTGLVSFASVRKSGQRKRWPLHAPVQKRFQNSNALPLAGGSTRRLRAGTRCSFGGTNAHIRFPCFV